MNRTFRASNKQRQRKTAEGEIALETFKATLSVFLQ